MRSADGGWRRKGATGTQSIGNRVAFRAPCYGKTPCSRRGAKRRPRWSTSVGAALQAEEPFDPPSDQCAVETALCSSNTVELFALSSRRSILHARQLNCTTFTEWEDLGGAFAGGPTAVKNARGQLEVFARGVDKHLYRRVSSGDCCAFDAAKWECLGGCFSSSRTRC